jgi:hypothetical protein
VPLCRDADGLRELVADYIEYSTHSHEHGAEVDTREEPLMLEREGFAKVVHAAWMELGDPAAAVYSLQQLLPVLSSAALPELEPEPEPEPQPMVDVAAGLRQETGGAPDTAKTACRAHVDGAGPTALTVTSTRDRVGRYNSSTLMKLLQSHVTGGHASSAGGRSDAWNYLQILRRHALADIYHYTIVLQSCGKMTDVLAPVGQHRGVPHNPAPPSQPWPEVCMSVLCMCCVLCGWSRWRCC